MLRGLMLVVKAGLGIYSICTLYIWWTFHLFNNDVNIVFSKAISHLCCYIDLIYCSLNKLMQLYLWCRCLCGPMKLKFTWNLSKLFDGPETRFRKQVHWVIHLASLIQSWNPLYIHNIAWCRKSHSSFYSAKVSR